MLLKELSEARGVSGNEAAVRELLLKAVENTIDKHCIDALGNLLCLKKARKPAANPAAPQKVLITAHMDEVGLIISGFNADGTLRYEKVGGIDNRMLLSKQVLVGEKAVPGVIGYRPIHLIGRSGIEKVADMSQTAIDIGASSRDAAAKLVQLGDYVTFRTSFEVLTEDGLRTAKGKALDDRVGCAELAEALEGEYAFDLYAAFTTQEEVGLRGARVAGYSINPDVAVALEGTVCDDLPKERDRDLSPVTELGKGPAISFRDGSVICDRRLVTLFSETAEQQGIPYQYKRGAVGGTDAGALHLVREGVPAAVLSVPCRYIHAPVSIVSLQDFDNAARLLKAALTKLEGGLEA
ncbi:MAG: M42 family metallopeptidase [Chloroflexi bacterium]|nr:M42 family metallopeptidase [Chloroflexota bacterium]